MQKYGIDEGEAYRRIQKQSMDKGMTMKELAQAIVIASDL
jgi:response regulator NasT